jgi:hypothetical protein
MRTFTGVLRPLIGRLRADESEPEGGQNIDAEIPERPASLVTMSPLAEETSATMRDRPDLPDNAADIASILGIC